MQDEKINIKLLEILNEKNSEENRYTVNEIINAFGRADYNVDNKRIKKIYEYFFHYCTPEDEKILCLHLQINKRNIKNIYISSSYRKIEPIAVIWDKRYRLKDRLYHPTTPMTPRSDNKYIEIDNFKTYELTPCIAYEMASRNDEVKLLLKRYDKIIKMQNDDKYMCHRFFTERNFDDAKNHSLITKEYYDLTFQEYETLIRKKIDSYDKLIENDYKLFIDKYIDKCTELGMYELKKLEEKIIFELINEYLIYPEGYRREVAGSNFLYNEEILNSKKKKGKKLIDKDTEDKGWQIRYEEIIYDEFIQVQGVYIKNSKYFINNIIPNFSRQVNDQNQITIPINLSLPLEEITEYIRIVQKKAKIKSPLELLTKELAHASNLTDMNTVNIKGKDVRLNATRGEQKQYHLSSMLYIYDMLKMDFQIENIKKSILAYYCEKSIKDNFQDSRTIEKYFEITKAYIEDKRYKELITGKN